MAAALLALVAGCTSLRPLPTRDVSELLPRERDNWNRPARLTSRAAGVLGADYSQRRRLLIVTARESGSPSLWLQADAPLGLAPARMLAPHSARDSTPRLSPHARRLAFASTRQDAAADIYVLTLKRGDVARVTSWALTAGGLLGIVGSQDLLRLTDLRTADAHPCWRPDGRSLFFASAPKINGQYDIYELDLRSRERTRLTDGGGQMPDCSPDGRCLVYVARSQDESAVALYVMRLADRKVARLTEGDNRDVFPCWSADGRRIFFTRYGLDSDGNGKLTTDDRPSLFSVTFDDGIFADGPLPPPRQLTSYAAGDTNPRPVPGGVMFSSNRGPGGQTQQPAFNLWALSEGGEAPSFGRVSEFLSFAGRQDAVESTSPWTRLLAWQNAMWAARESQYSGRVQFALDRRQDAVEAWLRTSDLLADLGFRAEAMVVLEDVAMRFADSEAAKLTARARMLTLDRRGLLDMKPTESEPRWPGHLAKTRELLAECLAGVAEPAGDRVLVATASLRTASALSLLESGLTLQAMKRYPDALEALARVAKDYPEQAGPAARAMLARAEVYELAGQAESAQTVRLALLRTYADAEPYAGQASSLVVDSIADAPSDDVGPAGRLPRLRKLIEDFGEEPVLPALAQNRIGDLFYEDRDYARARDAFLRTIKQFPNEHRQAAVAYLALAAIDVDQRKYAAALAYYRELQERLRFGVLDSDLYRRARNGYINTTLMKADREMEEGDVALAASTYARLLEFDPALVAAHRGLAGCRAQMGRLDDVILRYRPLVKRGPRDDVSHYALALAYSYYGPSNWVGDRSATRRRVAIDREALKVLAQAILVRYDVSYYHQLRGFLFNRIAVATGGSDAQLQALDSYLAALGLSDPQVDRVGYANALLNVAEGYLLVGRHSNALEYYGRALDAGLSVAGKRGQATLEHMSRSALSSGGYNTSAELLRMALDSMGDLPPAGDEAESVQRLRRRATLLDQLAMARYLNQEYADAVDAYSRTADALEQLMQRHRAARRDYRRNLLRAHRQQAVNIYRAVQSGQMAPHTLQQAHDLLQGVLEDLGRVGVVEQEDDSLGLITIDVQVALGHAAALAEFDEKAEKRLTYTYLARIAEEAGDDAAAAAMLAEKLALYPRLPRKNPPSDQLTELAIVWSQLARHRARAGYLKAAADAFRRAMELDALGENLQGEMAHCRSLGRMALKIMALGSGHRPVPDDELGPWLERIVDRHRDLLTRSAESESARLAPLAVGLAASLAQLTPLVEEMNDGR